VRLYLEKALHKEGLVEWVNMQALNSSPSTAKKKKSSVKRGLRLWKVEKAR
jgi:hypothetical protein